MNPEIFDAPEYCEAPREMTSLAAVAVELDEAMLVDANEAVVQPLLHKPMDGTTNPQLREGTLDSTLL